MTKKADNPNPKDIAPSSVGNRHFSAADIDSIIATCPGGLPKGQFDIRQLDPKGTSVIPHMVDRRTALQEKLERAVAWNLPSRSLPGDPSPSEMKKRFQAIETSARNLLKSLGLPDTDDLYDPFDPPDPDEISLAVLRPLIRQAELTGPRIDGFPNHPPVTFKLDGDSYTDYNGSAQLQDVIEGVKFLRGWSAKAKENAAERVGSGGKRNKGNVSLSRLLGELTKIWVEIFEQPIRTSVGNPETELAGKATGPMVRYIQACLAPLKVSMPDEAIRDRIRAMFQGKGKSSPEET